MQHLAEQLLQVEQLHRAEAALLVEVQVPAEVHRQVEAVHQALVEEDDNL